MPKQTENQADGHVEPSGGHVHVDAVTLVGRPATIFPVAVAHSEELRRKGFRGALNEVDRPVKGKYADVLPSSEAFIREKRREAKLEDRPS